MPAHPRRTLRRSSCPPRAVAGDGAVHHRRHDARRALHLARGVTVPPLPHARAMLRALRPFTRRLVDAAPARRTIDEAVTAEQSAAATYPVPAWHRAGHRWLDLVLVVDTGPSMAMWTPTLHEVRRLIEQSGVFRRVQVLPLTARRLPAARHGAALVFTDGTGPQWRDGSAVARVRQWAEHRSVALLNPLPPTRWPGTALSAARGRVLSARPALANRSWSTTGRRGATPLPVLHLSDRFLERWANLVCGPPVWYDVPLLVPPAPIPVPAPMSASELVDAFRAAASPMAFDLACRLAAAPLTLPTMRLVQRAQLPRSTPADLAEVLLGGLLHCDSQSEDSTYDFLPGVRAVLQRHLTRDTAFEVIDLIGAHVTTPGTETFRVLALPGDAQPRPSMVRLASVAADLLHAMGGPVPEDDRSVEVSGDPDGYPVVYLHGGHGDAKLPDAALRRLGVRLIVFQRAHGRSVAGTVRDIRLLADFLDLEQFAVLGESDCGQHALAAAASDLLTGRISRVAVVSGPTLDMILHGDLDFDPRSIAMPVRVLYVGTPDPSPVPLLLLLPHAEVHFVPTWPAEETGQVEALIGWLARSSPPDVATFVHEARLHDDATMQLETMMAMMYETVARDEPLLVAVRPATEALLRERLGDFADRVRIADVTEIGRNPARMIPWTLSRFLDEHAGRRARIIIEAVWPDHSTGVYAAWMQYEAMINLAFGGRDAAIFCFYGGEHRDVVQDVSATHPVVIESTGLRASDAYKPLSIADTYNVPLLNSPHHATTLRFEVGDIVKVRRAAAEIGLEADLPPDRISDLQVAVSELTTNSIRHGGGSGILRTWYDDERVVCEVSDAGHITDVMAGQLGPDKDDPHNRGLMVVNAVADLVERYTTQAGTTTRVHFLR
ncbi:sensor histidine kinase [Dactylosporangium sp. NBC_01737]|uniref:sensor histidine kinase n=1 Tax=Dactylosporangium sp. NBC_01737 TaxID=2975959 RepID=UPI002E10679B|nr:sensor histidine kinase [Dactylosporangium sp. NBC_01737]